MTPAQDLFAAIDAEAVAERAAACRSVARLTGGAFGEVATYLPGRRVTGVRIGDDKLEVHVVACWGVRVPELAAEVRQAVGPIAGGLAIDVHVDDLDVPGGSDGVEVFVPDRG